MALAVGLTAGCVALAACSQQTPAARAAGGSTGAGVTITLYNAQHEQTTDALVAAFTRQTGIQVRVDNNDEDVLTAQIEQEGDRSPADVFYTENSNWLQQLADRGLLAKANQAALHSVPTADSAADDDWVGVSARISVLVYNTDKLKASELPTSVLQLADPTWAGKIEIAPAETDFWPIVSSIAKAKGSDAALAWLKGIQANAGSNDNVPDNETLTSDVAKGSTELALINHYYYYRLKSEIGSANVHAQIAYFAPQDPGYVQDISGAAVLKSSQHQAAAQEFLDFLTSTQGQQILANGASFEYPIHPGVAANPELTPLNQLHPNDFTPADLGTGLDAEHLLQQAGLL